MIRSILAVIAGLLTWMVVTTLFNLGMRAGIAGYHQAEPVMCFTLPMKIARLIMAGRASLAACAVVALIAPLKTAPRWVFGALMLAFFIPVHVQLWAKFPVWYHLTFLGTLLPLVVLGA